MSVFTSPYWKRVLNGGMIVDIEHPCILNGAIFIPAISGTESDVGRLPARCKSLFRCRRWSMESPCITFILSLPKKPRGWNWSHFLHTVHRVSLAVPCSYKFRGPASVFFSLKFAGWQERFRFLNCERSGIHHHETQAGWKCICSRHRPAHICSCLEKLNP